MTIPTPLFAMQIQAPSPPTSHRRCGAAPISPSQTTLVRSKSVQTDAVFAHPGPPWCQDPENISVAAMIRARLDLTAIFKSP